MIHSHTHLHRLSASASILELAKQGENRQAELIITFLFWWLHQMVSYYQVTATFHHYYSAGSATQVCGQLHVLTQRPGSKIWHFCVLNPSSVLAINRWSQKWRCIWTNFWRSPGPLEQLLMCSDGTCTVLTEICRNGASLNWVIQMKERDG